MSALETDHHAFIACSASSQQRCSVCKKTFDANKDLVKCKRKCTLGPLHRSCIEFTSKTECKNSEGLLRKIHKIKSRRSETVSGSSMMSQPPPSKDKPLRTQFSSTESSSISDESNFALDCVEKMLIRCCGMEGMLQIHNGRADESEQEISKAFKNFSSAHQQKLDLLESIRALVDEQQQLLELEEQTERDILRNSLDLLHTVSDASKRIRSFIAPSVVESYLRSLQSVKRPSPFVAVGDYTTLESTVSVDKLLSGPRTMVVLSQSGSRLLDEMSDILHHHSVLTDSFRSLPDHYKESHSKALLGLLGDVQRNVQSSVKQGRSEHQLRHNMLNSIVQLQSALTSFSGNFPNQAALDQERIGNRLLPSPVSQLPDPFAIRPVAESPTELVQKHHVSFSAKSFDASYRHTMQGLFSSEQHIIELLVASDNSSVSTEFRTKLDSYKSSICRSRVNLAKESLDIIFTLSPSQISSFASGSVPLGSSSIIGSSSSSLISSPGVPPHSPSRIPSTILAAPISPNSKTQRIVSALPMLSSLSSSGGSSEQIMRSETRKIDSSTIKAIGVRKLLEMITGGAFSDLLGVQRKFLTTFRYYMTPMSLLELLVTYYCMVDNEDGDSLQTVRLRVLAFLRFWLSNYFDIDFENDRIRNVVDSFLRNCVLVTGNKDRAEQLLRIISDKLTAVAEPTSESDNTPQRNSEDSPRVESKDLPLLDSPVSMSSDTENVTSSTPDLMPSGSDETTIIPALSLEAADSHSPSLKDSGLTSSLTRSRSSSSIYEEFTPILSDELQDEDTPPTSPRVGQQSSLAPDVLWSPVITSQTSTNRNSFLSIARASSVKSIRSNRTHHSINLLSHSLPTVTDLPPAVTGPYETFLYVCSSPLKHLSTSNDGAMDFAKFLFLLKFPRFFAEQLAISSYACHSKLRWIELTQQRWTWPNKLVLCPNVVRNSANFNMIGSIVYTTILRERLASTRAARMEQWIAIALQSFSLNNICGTMAIIAGLDTTPIARLADTWALVRPEFDNVRQLLKLVFHGNYRYQRKLLETAALPCVPFLGMFLSDLTFLEDGNESITDAGLVNWFKFQRISDTIDTILRFSEKGYSFIPIQGFQVRLQRMVVMEYEQALQTSKILEQTKKKSNNNNNNDRADDGLVFQRLEELRVHPLLSAVQSASH